MPCNSDYMHANNYEIKISQVMCLLDELKGKKWTNSSWDGYHPKVYNKGHIDGDKLVSELCVKLQKVSVTDYSLEMQLWWRDHLKADKERVNNEIRNKKGKAAKAAALAKLTPHERELLNLD